MRLITIITILISCFAYTSNSLAECGNPNFPFCITSMTPPTLPVGYNGQVEFVGTNFQDVGCVQMGNTMRVSNLSVNSDGTTITINVEIPSTYPAGQCYVTFLTDGCSGLVDERFSFPVVPIPNAILINPSIPNPSIDIGSTVSYTATGTFSDGTSKIITSGVTWVSSDPSIVTIDQNGLATGVAAGNAQISANYSGLSSPPSPIRVLAGSSWWEQNSNSIYGAIGAVTGVASLGVAVFTGFKCFQCFKAKGNKIGVQLE